MINWLVANPDQTNAVAAVASAGIGLLALIVAGISIFFTARGLALQRQHNRLSVLPVPLIALADYENHIRAKIRNDGIGPLLVNRIVYKQGNKENEFNDLVSYMPKLPDDMSWANFSSGYVRSIRPGDELILLELDGKTDDPAFTTFRDKCRKVLTSIQITVEYTDVYSSSFPSCSRKLDWFGRRLASSRKA